MRRIAALMVLSVVAIGCAPANAPTEPTGPGHLERWRDPEYRVVCWIDYNKVSCLPESDVVLR